MRRIANIICLVLWSICLGVAVVEIIQGVTVHPVQVMLPCFICVMHYAGAIQRDGVKEDEKLIKEITK